MSTDRTLPDTDGPGGGLARPLVVLATKGRPQDAARLLDYMSRQQLKPKIVVVVGTADADLPQLGEDLSDRLAVVMLKTSTGLTTQRNFGMTFLQAQGVLNQRHFLCFFDDDFRPADDGLAKAAAAFANNRNLVGLTGRVLADGINGPAIDEGEASNILLGIAPSRKHWSAVTRQTEVESLYGCNMAVRAEVAALCRFDEGLPLYGWQEDCDFTGQLRRRGAAAIVPDCKGVHLGVKGSRVSGLRMGYSQVANPLRISARKNMSALRAARFICRALAANLLRARASHATVDYRGRLAGNLRALSDLLLGRCDPLRVTQL
jgi:hypothetical protein